MLTYNCLKRGRETMCWPSSSRTTQTTVLATSSRVTLNGTTGYVCCWTERRKTTKGKNNKFISYIYICCWEKKGNKRAAPKWDTKGCDTVNSEQWTVNFIDFKPIGRISHNRCDGLTFSSLLVKLNFSLPKQICTQSLE